MKSTKKILIISAYFYPENKPRAFRTVELVKELSKRGHDITVLTLGSETHHATFEKEYGVKIKNLGPLSFPTFHIKKNSYLEWPKRILNRLMKLLFDYPSIELLFRVKKAIQNENNYDALISIAAPHSIHWGVALEWKKNNSIAKIWIADCGDPYMGSKHDRFNRLYYFHILENLFLKRCDYVTIPFKEMQRLFNKKYGNKFKVIPQGFDFDSVEIAEYKPNKPIKFAYSGSVIPGARDPFSLIDFLINNQFEFEFHLYIPKRQRKYFSKYEAYIGSKIIMRDYIPRTQLIYELSKFDFLLNINTDKDDGKINAIPTKLIDYRLSKRPILSYEQSQLPISTIKEFLSRNYTNGYIDPNFDRYNIVNVTDKFLNLIEK